MIIKVSSCLFLTSTTKTTPGDPCGESPGVQKSSLSLPNGSFSGPNSDTDKSGSAPATHRDLEGAVGDVLPSEAHVNHVVPGRGCRVEDVEGAVLVLQNLGLHLAAVGLHHHTAHLPFPSTLGAHHHAQLLPNGHRGSHARTCSTFFFFFRISPPNPAVSIRFHSDPHTGDGALAGISTRHGANSVRGGGDVVSAVLDDDGVASRTVRDVGHAVGSVPVLSDGGLLRFAILVLMEEKKIILYSKLTLA